MSFEFFRRKYREKIMNIKEAKQEIVQTIEAYTSKTPWGEYSIPTVHQRPLLLIGPPGIGKTAVMAQAARECQAGFVSYTMTHHTRQSAIGLPFIREQSFGGKSYSVTEYTMSEIIASVYRCMEETGCRKGLLFLDEINCVSETLAPAILQFLQNKTFGPHRLPQGWVIAAAGNPPEYNKSVREFDLATLDRLKVLYVEADFPAWEEYAALAGIHSAVLSYLRLHPDSFYQISQSSSQKAYATARGWEDLSYLLLEYEALGYAVTEQVIFPYISVEEISHDFFAYYQLCRKWDGALPVSGFFMKELEARNSLLEKLQKSSPEEAMYLVQLLLSRLRHDLREESQKHSRRTLYREMFEKLERFLSQDGAAQKSAFALMEEFLQKEREVLEIRFTHNLSDSREYSDTKGVLLQLSKLRYQLSPQVYQPEEALSELKTLWENTLDPEGEETSAVTQKLEASLELLEESENDTALSFFLSSLLSDPNLAEHLALHPSSPYEKACRRFQYARREKELKEKLSSLFTDTP